MPITKAPSSSTATPNRSPTNETSELDLYAAEFAKLVDRYVPSRTETPSDWLQRLPDEAFSYYHHGTVTFGREAETPIERRGRLYLIHTALVFMWMTWGKSKARRLFQSHAHKGTRRTASMIMLEHYRRGGMLSTFDVPNWFFQPVDQWQVILVCDAVRTERVEDASLKHSLRTKTTVQCPAKTFSELRASGALPDRDRLSLD
jgi:hypothetical protein